MEWLAELLARIEKLLGPKFAPIILGLIVVGLLLHPIDAWHNLESNQKAQARELSALETHVMKMEKTWAENQKEQIQESKSINTRLSTIEGFLKQHSKEE